MSSRFNFFEQPLQICYVCDQKAGHMAHVDGLLDSLQREHIVYTQTRISINTLSWWQRVRLLIGSSQDIAQQLQLDLNQPILLVACGHHTHVFMLLLKWRLSANALPLSYIRSLVVLKPSLPLRWFDLIMLPQHDVAESDLATPTQHYAWLQDRPVFLFQGALHDVRPSVTTREAFMMVLLGGGSTRYEWKSEHIMRQLMHLNQQLSAQPQLNDVHVFESRRTPTTFNVSEAVTQLNKTNALHPWQVAPEMSRTEYKQYLQQARWIVVTEDSVSMIYEALGAGCNVLLLELPKKRHDRVTKAIDALKISQVIVPVLSLTPDAFFAHEAYEVLHVHQADLAARWLIQHF